MLNVYIATTVFTISVIFVAMALMLKDESGAREQKLMVYFLCGILVQNVGYLLELLAGTMNVAIVAIKVQYLGSVFVPLCYCWFMYIYCFERVPQRFLSLLGIIDVGILAVVFTLDWHKLYYKEIGWITLENGHSYLRLEYGPVYPVFLVCSCAIPFSLTIITMLKAILLRPDEAASRKYKLVLFWSFLPVLALLSYAGKLTYVYDPTPATLGLILSLVVILVWRRRTFDFRRLATDVLLESMGDGVIALDPEKRIISYNQAAAGVFPALNGCRVGDGIAQVPDFAQEMLKEDANGSFSLNDRYYESHTKLILDQSQTHQGYVVLILDVTDTRNYIEEIKSVREQAEQANKAKSEFLANMSHEIRTPMNAIIGLSDIIMEESVGRKMYTYAGDIKSASQNLLAIINDILDLSKVEAGKMELVMGDYHVKAVVDEVVHMMDIAASQRGLLMKHEYDEKIPCCYYGDAGRIKQILINLLNNAVKFTKEGYVKITVGGRPGDVDGEEMLVFRVIDTGCGIREEDREKIFENFKQVDSKRNRSVEGTGLGLSITKRLIQLMHGTIELESVYGEGTTFTVTIPQKIVDARALEEVPYVPAETTKKIEFFTARDYRVLVVDDNLINRKVAASFLEVYQFDLDEVESGPEAIKAASQKKYDMIFMDHMMPEMDGIEAARIIQEQCAERGEDPIIIALTANAMEGVREMFLRNGFKDFLTKPLDRKQLNTALLQWIPEDRRTAVEIPEDKAEMRGSQQDDSALRLEDIYIEGIDMVAARKYQSGTAEEYLDILNLYCVDGRRKIPLLKELYEKKDYHNYKIEVHGLKSASANVGAMSLSATAREHEEAAGREDGEFIDSHFEDLVSAYEKQLEHIQDFLDSRQENKQEKEEAETLDRQVFVQKVKEALEELEHFHSKECAALVKELLEHHLEEETREKLKEIQEQLNLYEDTLAEELLHALLEEFGE